MELTPTFTVTNPEPEFTGWTGDGSGMRDGVIDTESSVYASSNAEGGHITADLGSLHFVESIAVQAIAPEFGGWGVDFLNGAIVLISRDGNQWQPIVVIEGLTDPPQLVSFSIGRVARYVRISREQGNWIGIGEFRVFGRAERPLPPVFARYMTQVATYWAPGGNDGFGNVTFAAPEVVKCRWQDVAIMFRDPQAREVASDAVVYVDHDVEVGGYLALGDHSTTNPRSVEGAKEIRQVQRSPSLSGDEVLIKAIL